MIRAGGGGALALIFALAACGQGLARFQVAGVAEAAQFQWRARADVEAAAGGAGTLTFDVADLTLPDGGEFEPWSAGTPVLVADGAGTETVTLTSSTCRIGGVAPCRATAVFRYAHAGRMVVSSASDGLQEAIDYLGPAGGVVALTPAWNGTPAQIAAATGNAGVAIEDERAGGRVWYNWTGAGYSPSVTLAAGTGALVSRDADAVLHAAAFPGSDAGAQINACLLALPANGGVCDARGLAPRGGSAAAAENMFAGVSAPFLLLLGPYTLVVAAPQTLAAPATIRGEGAQTLLYFSPKTGTLLTVAYPQGTGLAYFPMAGLFSLYLGGPGGAGAPGGPTATVGVQIGPPTGTSAGAAGFTLDHVTVRQFGTNVALGDNAYSIRLSHDYFEDAGTDLLLPAGTINSGEMVSLVDDFLADANYGAQILGIGYEVEAVDCSFDADGLALSMTADALFTAVNSHWEGSNLQPFLSASAGEVSISGGQFVSDAASGAWPSYIQASGAANVSVRGAKVNSFGSQLAQFVQWSSTGSLALRGNTFDPVANVAAAAPGFAAGDHGTVFDPSAGQESLAANLTVFGAARLGSEGLGSGVARNGVTIGAQSGRTLLQWQSYGGSTGPYLAVNPAAPETMVFGAGGQDRMTLDGAGNLVDSGGAAQFQSLALGGGATLHEMLQLNASPTLAAVPAQSCEDAVVALAGAGPGAGVTAAPTASLGAATANWTAWVSAPGQIDLRVCNAGATAVTPASVVWSFWVWQ